MNGVTLKRKIAFYKRLGYKYDVALRYAKEDLKLDKIRVGKDILRRYS